MRSEPGDSDLFSFDGPEIRVVQTARCIGRQERMLL
jgi:hypothetical protein